jgi:hypothetical protein
MQADVADYQSGFAPAPLVLQRVEAIPGLAGTAVQLPKVEDFVIGRGDRGGEIAVSHAPPTGRKSPRNERRGPLDSIAARKLIRDFLNVKLIQHCTNNFYFSAIDIRECVDCGFRAANWICAGRQCLSPQIIIEGNKPSDPQ